MRGPGIPEHETARSARQQSRFDRHHRGSRRRQARRSARRQVAQVPLFADAEAPWRSALLIESPVTRFERESNRYAGVRTTTRKYVKYDGGFEELFDLAADPHELRNKVARSRLCRRPFELARHRRHAQNLRRRGLLGALRSHGNCRTPPELRRMAAFGAREDRGAVGPSDAGPVSALKKTAADGAIRRKPARID